MPEPASIPPGRSAFAKVAVLVAAGGVTACGLLAVRQARLQAFHETAASQLRLQQHEERVFEVRAWIASQITPVHIRQMAADLGPIRSIGVPAPPDTVTVANGQLDRGLNRGEPSQ